MAPKGSAGSSPRKAKSTQTKLNFKTTKPGVASSKKAKPSQRQVKPKPEPESDSEDDVSDVIEFDDLSDDEEHRIPIKLEHLDSEDEAGHYKKYYKEVKKQLGPVPPSKPFVYFALITPLNTHTVHTEGESKVYQMLRVFDNTENFGPCVGLTRIERWERAKAMGLNPPSEVLAIYNDV